MKTVSFSQHLYVGLYVHFANGETDAKREMTLTPLRVFGCCDLAQGVILGTHLIPSSWKTPVYLVVAGLLTELPPLVALGHPVPSRFHCPSHPQVSISLVHQSFVSFISQASYSITRGEEAALFPLDNTGVFNALCITYFQELAVE